ncbi:hypothetical protein, partial [Pelagicoccus sp. SDUM812002]|uniref:phosphotransferase-like protein n=1 Tax=Pelagicoccus sp. SDUM812002 TaxID=3041266 RepID=UPI00280E3141
FSRKMKTNAIIILGPTSSGKTELSKALQEAFLPQVWLSFSVDSLIYSLPPSVLERCNKQDDWNGVDGNLLSMSAVSCLKCLLSSGNRVIFDTVIPSETRFTELQSALSEFRHYLVELKCEWKEIERRTSSRVDRSISEASRSYKATTSHLKPDSVFDSSELSASEMAERILTQIDLKEKKENQAAHTTPASAPR